MAHVKTSRFRPLVPTNLTVPEAVLSGPTFEKSRNRKAIIDAATGASVTYNELLKNVLNLSASLGPLGLKEGDIALLFAPNFLQSCEISLSIMSTGAIFSTMNPVYTAREIEHQLHDSEPKFIFVADILLPKIVDLIGGRANLTHVIVVPISGKPLSLPQDSKIKFLSINSLYNHPVKEEYPLYQGKSIKSSAYAALFYSSGTTGLSKGAILTHDNLVINYNQLAAMNDDPLENEAFLCVLPLFHAYGYQVVLNGGLFFGATIVLSTFSPLDYLQNLEKYKITQAHCVPPIILALVKLAESNPQILSKINLSSVRVFVSGAAPLSPEIESAFRKHYKIQIKQAYGMTEASPVTHANPSFAPRVGSIGLLAPNMEAKIIDINGNTITKPGVSGELLYKGPNVFKGYWKRNDNHTLFDSDDFFYSGDVAYVDEDGYFYLVDRIKELIKCKGFQVPPAELEGIILTHQSIADAAVIGVDDLDFGEVPRAFVVVKPNHKITEQEVVDFVKNQVAPYKQLRGGVVFVDSVPKTASGKILRRVLREQLKNQKAKL